MSANDILYALFYIETSSLGTTFDNVDDAMDALKRLVAQHPDIRDNVIVVGFPPQDLGKAPWNRFERMSHE